MDGRGPLETLRWCYMEKDKFSLSWIKMREKYDLKSRSDLLLRQYKKDNSFFKKIIDLGSGNGSFLRYCHTKKIIFDDMTLIDYDPKLLRNFYTTTCKYLKNSGYSLLKELPTKYKLKKMDETKTRNIKLINNDISKSFDIIDSYNLISLSAMSDILPISFIKKLLNNVSKNKIIYLSICFSGTVDWHIKHKYDKYIVSMFNNHQEMNKGSGYAIGAKSIKLIKGHSIKKQYKVSIKDSSWKINSNTEDDKTFQRMYLDTIYRPLKKDENTDKEMLLDWKEAKLRAIQSGRSKIIVGHKDILIKT
jgi:hypothetical protein